MGRILISQLPERISKFIEPEPYSGCWLWAGSHGDRYARLQVGSTERLVLTVTRSLWEMYVGGIEESFELDHLCKTPFCVNPAHLEPVTRLVNQRRYQATVPLATHCKKGHELTPEKTLFLKGSAYRRCRICYRDRTRAWRSSG
jgi:hypothetical protein